MLAYDWSMWRGYLLPLVAPDAHRICAIPGETTAQIVARSPSGFEGVFGFHIDLTTCSRCPNDRGTLKSELAHLGISTLNVHIVDISKRFVQGVCRRAGLNTTEAAKEGDPSELLIVKTNRNYGGRPEAKLSSELREAFEVSEEATHDGPDHGYVVVPRIRVPLAAWNNPASVVERFVENDRYVFYRAYFLRHRFAISEGRERALIKTIGRAERLRLVLFSTEMAGNIVGDIPADLQSATDALLRFTRMTSMEFGCLDILRDQEDQFYIVDMNATPHWGAETEFRIIDHLAGRYL
jgi:hypothetical protein